MDILEPMNEALRYVEEHLDDHIDFARAAAIP